MCRNPKWMWKTKWVNENYVTWLMLPIAGMSGAFNKIKDKLLATQDGSILRWETQKCMIKKRFLWCLQHVGLITTAPRRCPHKSTRSRMVPCKIWLHNYKIKLYCAPVMNVHIISKQSIKKQNIYNLELWLCARPTSTLQCMQCLPYSKDAPTRSAA